MWQAFVISFLVGIITFTVVDGILSMKRANKLHMELMADLDRRKKEELKFYQDLRKQLNLKPKTETPKQDLRKYLENHL